VEAIERRATTVLRCTEAAVVRRVAAALVRHSFSNRYYSLSQKIFKMHLGLRLLVMIL
jgi:hypothetical protein